MNLTNLRDKRTQSDDELCENIKRRDPICFPREQTFETKLQKGFQLVCVGFFRYRVAVGNLIE